MVKSFSSCDLSNDEKNDKIQKSDPKDHLALKAYTFSELNEFVL